MKAQGLGASEIAKALKIGRASVYQVPEADDAAKSQSPASRLSSRLTSSRRDFTDAFQVIYILCFRHGACRKLI